MGKMYELRQKHPGLTAADWDEIYSTISDYETRDAVKAVLTEFANGDYAAMQGLPLTPTFWDKLDCSIRALTHRFESELEAYNSSLLRGEGWRYLSLLVPGSQNWALSMFFYIDDSRNLIAKCNLNMQ